VDQIFLASDLDDKIILEVAFVAYRLGELDHYALIFDFNDV
jgi:hypothetical protein